MARRKSLEEISRTQDIERIVRFLESPYGGALLLGGDRGSGKTKLIDMAVQEYQHHTGSSKSDKLLWFLPRHPRTLVMSKVIKVHIPLIILDTEDEKKLKEDYRSMLMRAMLIGLEADLSRRYYAWLDLPKRWFSSIGYVQTVYSLRHHVRYLSLSKSTSKALSAPSGLALTPAVQSAITAEVDLTDSTLEIKLRTLLTQYSKIHDFIFIFDELDKLPEAIKVESVVLYLKNLFSETGVHALFLSSEKDLKRVMKKAINGIPPNEESTLFVDLVLLNNMKLDEFSQLVRERVVIEKDDKNVDMNELIYALALRTNKSPHELHKFVTRHSTRYPRLIRGLKTELGAERFSKLSVMHVFINYVYQKYSELYDQVFSRTLEDALQTAGTLLLGSDQIYMNRVNTDTIFYASEHFNRSDLSKDEVLANEKAFKGGTTDDVVEEQPEIIKKLDELWEEERGDKYIAVEYAIECLVVLLNRSGYLQITDTDMKDVVMLKGINQKLFTHENVRSESFEDTFKLTAEEMETLQKIKKYNPAFVSMTKANIYDPLPVVGDENDMRLDAVDGLRSSRNLRVYWDQLASVADKCQERILRQVVEQLNTMINTPIDQSWVSYDGKNMNIVFPNGLKAQIVLLYDKQRYKIDSGVTKTFILRDLSAKYKHKGVLRNVKNLPVNNNWQNIQTMLRNVADWISSNT